MPARKKYIERTRELGAEGESSMLRWSVGVFKGHAIGSVGGGEMK